MTDEKELVAAFIPSTDEMITLEEELSEVLSAHMALGPLIHIGILSRMLGVVIGSSTLELTEGMMSASVNILHGYNLKMTEDMPADKKDLN